MVKIFILIVFIYCSHLAFAACESSFIKVDQLTTEGLRNLDLDTIHNLPAIEVRKFTEEHFRLFDSDQLVAIPFKYLLSSQVYALKHRVNDIFDKKLEMQESDPEIFSLIIRINLRYVSPKNIPLISPPQIRRWTEHDIKKLTDKQIQAFESEQIIAFGSLVVHFSPEQIQAFGENIQHFLSEQFALFSYKQGEAITMEQLAVLNENQRQSLQYIKHYLYL